MECNKDRNLERCNCINMRQLPAFVFPADAERTCDRSYEHFARLVNEGRV